MNKYLKKTLQILIVFVAYFITAKIGLSLKPVSGFATLVWPPTGIALAALLFWGYEMAIGIALAAFCVNFFIIGGPILAVLGIMIGNTLEAVVGVYLLNNVAKFNKSMDRVSDVIGFVVFGSVIATLISATFGATSLLINHALTASYSDTWLAWWIGDSLGVLVVGSFILAWSKRLDIKFGLEEVVEFILLIVFSILLNLAIFTNLLVIGGGRILSLNYLLVLPIIWAATRFKQRGATLAVIITDVISIFGTAQGTGPFSDNDLSANLLELEIFIFIIATVGLIISSAKAEVDNAQRQYRQLNEELEKRIDERTSLLNEAQKITRMGSWEWYIDEDRIIWTDELYEIFGVERGTRLTYDSFLSYIDPEDRIRVEAVLQESIRTRKPFEVEYRIDRQDGLKKTVSTRGGFVFDKNGQFTRMRGIVQDITDVKDTQSKLARRNEELEKLNKFMIDRESKMAELKKAIADLQAKTGK